MSNLTTFYKLSALEEDILTILSFHKLYGLQIREVLKKSYEGSRNIGDGLLYPTLHRMENKNYIESEWGEDRPEERNGARRKYYKITGFGQEALKNRHKVLNNLRSLAISLT